MDLWSIILQLATLATVIMGAYKIGRWTRGIEARIEKLENHPLLVATENVTVDLLSKIIYNSLEKFKANPIPEHMVRRRLELTEKLEKGTITKEEAEELKNILHKELEEAQAMNNLIAALAIILLLGLVIAFLKSLEEK